MSFSPVSSAFAGFRLATRKPGTVALWMVAYVVLTIAVVVAIALVALPAVLPIIQGGGNPFAPGGPRPNIGYLILAGAVAIPLILIMSSIMTAAVLRSVLKPEMSGFAYLRLGGDEFRLAVVMFVLGLVFAGIYLVFVLLLGGISMAAGKAGPLVMVILGLGLLIGLLYLGSRLCLAYPTTLMQKRISIFDSWNRTKPFAMGLVGMWLLVGVVVVVMAVVNFLVSRVLEGQPIGAGMFAAANTAPNILSNGPVGIVLFLLAIVFNLFMSTLQLCVLCAPQAEAYRDIVGADVAKEF